MHSLLLRIVGVVATALWAVALMLMIFATWFRDALLIGHWALFTGLVAALLTCWCLMRVERQRVETIATLVSAPPRPDEGLRRV